MGEAVDTDSMHSVGKKNNLDLTSVLTTKLSAVTDVYRQLLLSPQKGVKLLF